MKLRIYISGAFTNISNWIEVSQIYEYVAKSFNQNGFGIYLPHSKTPPTLTEGLTSEEVFLRDFDEIKKSQIIFAFLDNPSHGVGAEIALALNLGLIVVGVSHNNIKISRFIEGLLQNHPNGYFFKYENIDEIQLNFVSIINSRNDIKDQLLSMDEEPALIY
jgi:hypothetical protein